MTQEAEKLVYDLKNENKNLSAHEIISKLKTAKANNPNLFSYFNTVINRLTKSGQIKNAEVYKDTKRNLSYFTNGKEIHFSDVDFLFLNKWQEYLQSNGKGPNTIYIYLRTLRALLNKAIKEDVSSEKYYPFKKFSLSKYANIRTEKRAITKDEIERIRKLRLANEPDLQIAQFIFLFGFYCRGMNFVDIANLKWKNIHGNRLSYTRQKTNELFNMELLEPARIILNQMKLMTFTENESHVFPIFTEAHNTPQKRYNRRIKMLRQVNKDLKTIGDRAKIKSVLTTYVARHSFATILKKSGISTSVISQALGHDSEKTTQIYLDSFENKIIDDASKRIL
jgi:site-specific recombinase XerD